MNEWIDLSICSVNFAETIHEIMLMSKRCIDLDIAYRNNRIFGSTHICKQTVPRKYVSVSIYLSDAQNVSHRVIYSLTLPFTLELLHCWSFIHSVISKIMVSHCLVRNAHKHLIFKTAQPDCARERAYVCAVANRQHSTHTCSVVYIHSHRPCESFVFLNNEIIATIFANWHRNSIQSNLHINKVFYVYRKIDV